MANKHRKEMEKMVEPVEGMINKLSTSRQKGRRLQHRPLKLINRLTCVMMNYIDNYNNKRRAEEQVTRDVIKEEKGNITAVGTNRFCRSTIY